MKSIINSGRRFYYVLLSAAFLLTVIFFVLTASLTKARLSDDCLVCHEDKDLTMEKNGKKISLYVNPAGYKNSKHGGFDCKDCHEGYNPEALPHNPNKKDIDCKSCHGDVKMSADNVHKSQKCYSCHDPHLTKSAKDLKAKQTESCLNCHKSKNVQAFTKSVHSRRNVGCESCHKGGHEVKKISRNEISSVCGKCHGSHQSDFNNSVHQTVLRGGDTKAPTCVDCHGSHNIISSKLTIESEACLKCHLDEKMFPGEEKGSAKFVSQYKTSIHTSIQKDGKPAAGCVDCHGDHMIESPNDPTKSTAKARLLETCGKCHNTEVDHFFKSAHGTAFKNNNPDAPSCTECHGEHDIKSVLQSDEFAKINQTEMCLSCHKDNRVNKRKDTHLDDYKNSFHYIALKNGNDKAATCSDCHGPHEMIEAGNPESQINKKKIDMTCGQTDCHVMQKEEYSGSIHHVSLMTKENSDSPNCNTCHGAHQVVMTDSLGKEQGSKQRGIVQLCSNCHASVELIENNDLPNVAGNYLESFHGLAVRGGSREAADCGSCHGNHNIRPSSDTLSSINKQNLGKTCGKCHPGANDVFINTKIHVLEASTENPLLYWITRFYIILIVGIIGAMVLHNILDYRKKLKEKKGH